MNPTPYDDTPRWQACNAAGLTYAGTEHWEDAADAFAEAAAEAPSYDAAPALHGVLLANLAQALFHSSDVTGAIATARRALSARLRVFQESDAPVARLRTDLAVYLGAAGEFHEGAEQIQCALSALEARYGDEDYRLSAVLENGARLALLAGHPAMAEPYLLRAHALQPDGSPASERIAALFTLVAASREAPGPVATDHLAAHSSDVDATACTLDVQLDDSLLDALPNRRPDAPDDVFGGASYTTRKPAPHARDTTSAGAAPAAPNRAQANARNPLGFVVQYGIPAEQLYDESDSPTHSAPRLPLRGRAAPTPLDLEAIVFDPEAPIDADPVDNETPVSNEVTPTDDVRTPVSNDVAPKRPRPKFRFPGF